MRQIIEYSKMAFRNIIGNKMRSLLTMLGIIIGISAVIIVLCIGGGGQKSIQGQLSGFATGSVFISASGESSTYADYITDKDIEAIANMSEVAHVSMLDFLSGTAQGSRNKDVGAAMRSGNGSYFNLMPSTLVRGRFWNESDYLSGRRVCTVDSTGAKELFGSDNVVGMKVALTFYGRTTDFTIVGVTQSESGMMSGMSRNVTAEFTAPFTTMVGVVDFISEPYFQIGVLANDPMQSGEVAKQVVNLLELRHGSVGRETYYVQDVNQMMGQVNSVISLFTTIIAAIAGISLLVGGIGVMNIMLVSVTERTREIGIRKALGAKTSTILFQFLIESATLTLVGGIIGIALGLWGGSALGSLMDIDASIGLDFVLYIALFSSVIGIFFGIYPARKAAKLNPIEALRSE